MRKQYQFSAMNTSICFLVKLSVGYQILHHVTFNIFSDSDISLHGSRRVYVEETSQHNCACTGRREVFPTGITWRLPPGLLGSLALFRTSHCPSFLQALGV